MARYGIGYKPKKGNAGRMSKRRLMRRKLKNKSVVKTVYSLMGKPETKLSHLTYTCADPGLLYYLKVFNRIDASDLNRTSVSKAFIFPVVGNTSLTRNGNRICVRKINIRLMYEIDQNIAGWAKVNSHKIRVIVFSGLKNPDFSSGTGSNVTGFWRWQSNMFNILNNVDQRDFTVWYDKTHSIAAAPYTNYTTTAPNCPSRFGKLININLKYRGKFREVVFDDDNSNLPKDQERNQLYVCAVGACPDINDNTLMGYIVGGGYLYWTDL